MNNYNILKTKMAQHFDEKISNISEYDYFLNMIKDLNLKVSFSNFYIDVLEDVLDIFYINNMKKINKLTQSEFNKFSEYLQSLITTPDIIKYCVIYAIEQKIDLKSSINISKQKSKSDSVNKNYDKTNTVSEEIINALMNQIENENTNNGSNENYLEFSLTDVKNQLLSKISLIEIIVNNFEKHLDNYIYNISNIDYILW